MRRQCGFCGRSDVGIADYATEAIDHAVKHSRNMPGCTCVSNELEKSRVLYSN